MKGSTAVVQTSLNLRDRIIDAASTIFVEEGYDSLSMRRVAQEVGCSQMAMYRHFANKEALIQHLCAQLYTRFTVRMERQMEASEEPWGRIRVLVTALIEFATSYPDHYSLIFLIHHSDAEVLAEREKLGQNFLKSIHGIVKMLLPQGTPAAIVDERLRQVLCLLHGTAALLIAHPKAYGLTRQKAVRDAQDGVACLLGCTRRVGASA